MTRPPHARARRRPARRILLVLLVLVTLLLAWAAWHGAQGVRDLRAAERELSAARATATDGALPVPQLRRAAELTRSAREHLDDPVLRALGVFPVLGVPRETASGLARAAHTALRDGVLPLVEAAGPAPADRLTSGPGAVDVERLAALAQPAAQATRALTQAVGTASSTPPSTGIAALDAARAELVLQLTQALPALEDLALVADVGPQLLGAQEPKRFLLVSQTPAEARGTGGLIGGYSLLEASDGAIRIVRSGPRTQLQGPGTPVVDLGQEFTDHYGRDGATGAWINSNISPHFPYAAQIWLALWERQYGERLDGALVVDPVALSYLLQAVGPVPLPGGEQVTADNVVDLTMRDVYARFDDDPRRDAFLQSVSSAVAAAVTTREPDGEQLARALARAVRERRLLLYAADDAVQARLADEPISGTLPQGRAVGDVVVDQAASKLDYYLERRLSYDAGCDGRSRLTLTLSNTAPPTGLPDYVAPRSRSEGEPAGTNRLRTTLYLPPDSIPTNVTLDGEQVPFRQGTERSLVFLEVAPVVIRPGDQTELVVDLLESPAPREAVRRIAQPLVRPERFRVADCIDSP